MKLKNFETAEELKKHLEETTRYQQRFWLPMVEVVHTLNSSDNLEQLKSEINEYLDFLRELDPSPMTHYCNLNEWSTLVHEHVYNMVNKHAFVNGKQVEWEGSPELKAWLEISYLTNDIIWSPKLKTNVSHHHSSALSRNNAIIAELEDILSLFADPEGE